MKYLLVNLCWFLFFYTPLTALIGVVTGAFSVPGTQAGISYELFLWFVVMIQLLIPTLSAFLIVLLCLGGLVRVTQPTRTVTRMCLLAMMLILPVCQAAIWAGNVLSLEWMFVAVVPAVSLALVARLPESLRHRHQFG